jgi:uncharacterized protein
MYGPLVLAAQLGNEGLTPELIYGNNAPVPDRLRPPMPEVHATADGISTWIKPAAEKGLVFETIGQRKTVSAIPLYRLFKERYSVYWKVNSQIEPG